jgi:uncharacterized membrane protein YebE (DUF533 family)
MDTTRLLTSLLGGVIGTRPKSHSKVSRFLGGSSGSAWNARTLLSVGALGWAAYEIYRSRSGTSANPFGAPGSSAGRTVVPGTTVVPSIPPSIPPLSGAARVPPNTPPPLPASASSAPIEPVRRLVGVLLAAARADGELGEAEYGRLLALAREAGGSALVGEELRAPTPLAVLCGGIPEPRAREDLYRLAFGIVRCDDGVTARERDWLDQLARALGLDRALLSKMELDVAQGITRS